MEARELRIGNLIQLYRRPTDNEMSIGVIIGVDDTNVELEDYFVVNHKKGISPIPLTEEWLLKFGFKVYNLNKGDKYLKDEIGKYNKDVDYFEYVISSGDDSHGGWNYDTVEIKYVHQLQNLYFALTGEELTIK